MNRNLNILRLRGNIYVGQIWVKIRRKIMDRWNKQSRAHGRVYPKKLTLIFKDKQHLLNNGSNAQGLAYLNKSPPCRMSGGPIFTEKPYRTLQKNPIVETVSPTVAECQWTKCHGLCPSVTGGHSFHIHIHMGVVHGVSHCSWVSSGTVSV